MKKLNKNQNGITLIALVITIIVLIILAGISISLLMGENGIISKAKQGALNYQSEADKERKMLDDIEKELNGEKKAKEIDLSKSTTIGKDTSKIAWDPSKSDGSAKLDLGETVNLLMKKTAALANGVSEATVNTYTVYDYEDTYITSIVWSSTEPTAAQKGAYGQIAMTEGSELGMYADGTTNAKIVSDVPIYIWYNSGTIYMWSSDSTIEMHPHSERMFQGMKNLTNISALSHFVPDSVESARFMFKDTKISDFSVCNNWNLKKVKYNQADYDNGIKYTNGFYQICNGTPGSAHPSFTKMTGIWDSEVSFVRSTDVYMLGQEVTVGGEQFFVIEENDTVAKDTILLISKYCIDPNTNLQSNEYSGAMCGICVAYDSNVQNSKGYWYEEGEDSSKYPYNLNGIESERATAYNKAVEYGESKGGEGRLLTKEEAETLIANDKIPNVIIGRNYTTGATKKNYLEYYLATAYNYGSVYFVTYQDRNGGLVLIAPYLQSAVAGIRPVITVSKDLVE